MLAVQRAGVPADIIEQARPYVMEAQKYSMIALQYIGVAFAAVGALAFAEGAINTMTLGLAWPLTTLISMVLSPVVWPVSTIATFAAPIVFGAFVAATIATVAIAAIKHEQVPTQNFRVFLPVPDFRQGHRLGGH
ncbi:MAG: hypothetical protein S4CHLAM102_03650 [Chlamydiia bacterium]|nr:hypothetical protein [Chlamydiia bacterium]